MLGTHEYQHVHGQIATLFSLWASCIFRLDFCSSPEMKACAADTLKSQNLDVCQGRPAPAGSPGGF